MQDNIIKLLDKELEYLKMMWNYSYDRELDAKNKKDKAEAIESKMSYISQIVVVERVKSKALEILNNTPDDDYFKDMEEDR